MFNAKILLIVSGVVAMICVTQPAFGQQRGSGAITGTVTDAQSAVIPGATVTLVHVDTNQTRVVTTNELGVYVFPLLAVGQYQLSVENSGFNKYQQSGLTVQVNETVRVDVQLEVGEITTTVTVEAAGTVVETSNATIKDVVDSRRVVDLPLNGRNLADLSLLVPGVQPAQSVAGGQGDGAKRSRVARLLSVNGSKQNNLKYTLDGGDNQDNLFNLANPSPFPDAVQEFSVQTSNAGVEIGKSSGGVVNIVTKSGTNEVHGNVFWFVRNTEFNANNFFSHDPDQLKRNQFGFTAGGPIIKNKLFVFGGYQRTWVRRAAGDAKRLSMPGPHRSGDFSGLLAGTDPIVITDPLSGEPFPNNMIPSSRHSQVAQNVLDFSPLPDADGFTRYTLTGEDDLDEQIIRADYRPNNAQSIYLRYYHNDDLAPRTMLPNNIHSNRRGIKAFAKNATLSHTHVMTPNLINANQFSVVRYTGNRFNDFPTTIRELGSDLNPSSNIIDVQISGTSGHSLGSTAPAQFARTNFEYTNTWRWIKGRHNFSWGGDLLWSRYNEINVFNGSGRFRFNGRITGFDQADYILGEMSSFRQSNGEIEARRYTYSGLYFGDSVRVRPRLTLNFAVRFEPFMPMTDLKDRSVQFRNENYAGGIQSSHFVNAPPGLLYPQDPDVPEAGVNSDLNNIAPRIGFAWDVTGNGTMSVRGGYGIFYDSPEMWLLNNMNVQTPFSFTVDFQGGSFDEPYKGREQFRDVFPFSGDFDTNTPYVLPFFTSAYQRDFTIPYTQNWNLTVEKQFLNDWVLRVGYVGTKSTQLYADFDLNAPIYDFSKTLKQNQDTKNVRRPRPEFERLILFFNGHNQSYNSLQVSLNKRFSQGFSILNSYTFSRNIDYNSENDNILDNQINNFFDFFDSRGLSNNHHKNRFASSFVWELPDPGEASGNRALSWIFGNWTTSGIITLQSGRPFHVRSSGDRAAGAGSPRADVVGPVELDSGRSRGAKIEEYFNRSGVDQASAGTFGTMGRNSLIGPGFANIDFSVFRRIAIPAFGERGGIMIRAEFFNLLNAPHLNNPGNRLGRSSFGRITSTAAEPRILQFAVKVEF